MHWEHIGYALVRKRNSDEEHRRGCYTGLYNRTLDRSSEGTGDAPSPPRPTASAHMTHVSQDQNMTSPHITSDLVSKIEK